MSKNTLPEVIENLGDSFAKFKENQDDKLDSLRSRVDQIELKEQRRGQGLGFDPGASAPDPDYTKAFKRYLQRGDASVLQDLQKKDYLVGAASGSYAVPEELDREIARQLLDTSPIRSVATVRPVTTSDYKFLVSERDGGAAWVAESGSRSKTATPTLHEQVPTSGELYTLPRVSNWFLNDAMTDVQAWLAQEAADKFAALEGASFLSGNGSAQPTGILNTAPEAAADGDSPARTWGAIQYIPTGVAGAFPNDRLGSPAGNPGDVLFDTVAALKAGYRRNAVWMMNSTTQATVRKWKDANGNYLYVPGLRAGEQDSLLGYPVRVNEDMPDIGANAFPILFGDFSRGYRIIDIGRTTMIVDQVTVPGFTNLYIYRRTVALSPTRMR